MFLNDLPHLRQLLFMLFILVCPLWGISQTYEEEMRMITNPFQRSDYQNPDSIFTALDRELRQALENKDTVALAQLYLRMGTAFGFLADYDKSTKYLYQAKEMFVSLQDYRRQAFTQYCLSVFANISRQQRLDFLTEAYTIYENECDTTRMGITLNGFGYVYAKEEMLDSAIKYFEKAKTLAYKTKYLPLLATVTGNIANWHSQHKNYKKALRLSLEAIRLMPEEHFISAIFIQYNILEMYVDRNMPDSALYYYDLYKDDLAARPNVQAETYKLLSRIYSRSYNDGKALEYYKKADSLREIIHKRNNSNLLQILDLEHQSELKKKEFAVFRARAEKDKAIYISLIIVFTIFIAFCIVLYYFQKEKAKKNHEARVRAETEQKLMQSELRNSELQRSTLNNELKFTNKELSSYAANIVKNTDHLNDIKKHVHMVLDEKNPKRSREQLRELNLKINQLFHKDEERKEFIKRTRQINHSLIFFLKSHYPQLNDNDLNLMVLLMLRFSSKEIAALSNLEPGSVKTKRYRLRRKLGIRDRKSFEDFMDDLIKDFKAVHSNVN